MFITEGAALIMESGREEGSCAWPGDHLEEVAGGRRPLL